MESNTRTRIPGFLEKVGYYFTTGVLVLAPTAVSVWVLAEIFHWFDNILGKWYAALFRNLDVPMPYIPGMGALTLILIIIVIGFIGRRYGGRKIVELWDSTINDVPVLNSVYTVVREISNYITKGEGLMFERPVLVQYPRKGLYSLGFITKRYGHDSVKIFGDGKFGGNEIGNIFIPTVPNPTSGVVEIVPGVEAVPLEMSFEDAVKFVVSGGIVSPDLKLHQSEEPRCSSEQPGQSCPE